MHWGASMQGAHAHHQSAAARALGALPALLVTLLVIQPRPVASSAGLPLRMPLGAFRGRLGIRSTDALGSSNGPAAPPTGGANVAKNATTTSQLRFSGGLAQQQGSSNITVAGQQQTPYVMTLTSIRSCSVKDQRPNATTSPATSPVRCQVLKSPCFGYLLRQVAMHFVVSENGSIAEMELRPKDASVPGLWYLQASMAVNASLTQGSCKGLWPAAADLFTGVGSAVNEARGLLAHLAGQLALRCARRPS